MSDDHVDQRSHSSHSAAAGVPPTHASDDEDNRPLFANFGKTFKKVAGAVARTAASAAELLKDEDMRKRGANVLAERARMLQQEVRNTINRAPKSLQGVLTGVQQRITDARLRARLEASRDAKVDVQVGLELFEGIPQEWRSRLWTALLQHPACASGFGEITEGQRITVRDRLVAAQQRNAEQAGQPHTNEDDTTAPTAHAAEEPSTVDAAADAQASPATDTPFSHEPPRSDPQPTHDEAADDGFDTASRHSSSSCRTDAQASRRGDPTVRVTMAVLPAVEEGGPPVVAVTVQEAPRLPRAPNKPQLADMARRVGRQVAPPRPEARTEAGDLGEWEVVAEQQSRGDSQGRWLLMHAGRQKVMWDEAVDLKQEALVDEVDGTEWPAARDEDAEAHYRTLLNSRAPEGETEDLDDVIGRDIHRTFPEHPQFGFQQGQQQLFRVLKAYALLDAEVGYCQGMAFLVGVLLMYLPEEPAFRTASALLMPPGPNLRRLYQPTMEGLKVELRKFEWLMHKYLPELLAHLEKHSVVSVLYAAQWFLTIFSCPFPPSFACRVIDIMLVERSDAILQRTAMAVMAECASDLMELDDFEDIITLLKTQLAGWTGKRARRVLSNAFMSPITLDVLASAEVAVQEGFHGSFNRMNSRLQSSIDEATTADEAAAPLAGAEESEDDYLRMVMEMDGLWGGPPRQSSVDGKHTAHVDVVAGDDQGGGEDPHHLPATATQ